MAVSLLFETFVQVALRDAAVAIVAVAGVMVVLLGLRAVMR